MNNQNSGGWRYGGNSSNQFFKQSEDVDNELLKRAAAYNNPPAGLLDAKVAANPLDQLLQQAPTGGSGGDGAESGGRTATPGHEATDAWGMNQYGVDVGFNPGGAAKGLLSMGPLGAVLGGITTSKDPLGKFAYDQLMAQEMRDLAYQNPQASGYQGLGGGLTQADVDQANASPDPIGSIAGSLGMAGDYSGFSDSNTGNDSSANGGGDSGRGSQSDAGGSNGDGHGFSRGGAVTRGLLSGPDPEGPDDGQAGLDIGEYVLKKSAVKKLGRGLLDQLNKA